MIEGVLALALLAMGAAADAPEPEALEAALSAFETRVRSGGPGAIVLNEMEYGVAALQAGRDVEARQALDDALDRIEAIYANDENARKARSLWYAEAVKDFKGEPYERAMAYYYRGIAALLANELNDAGGLFHGGSVQDAFAEEEQHRSDFAVLHFLEGWVAQRLGDRASAEEAYARVAELRPGFVPPESGDDLLLIVETGPAPRKVADGVGGYQLKFRRGKDVREERVEADLQGWKPLLAMEDVFWQASTRGGRKYDEILAEKARLAKRGDRTGHAAAAAGDLATNLAASTDMLHAGAAADAVSGIAFLFSAKTKSRADTRYWRNLPEDVHLLTAKAPEDLQSIRLRFLTAEGAVVEEPAPTVRVAKHPKYSIVWARSRPVTDMGNREDGRK